MRDDSDEAKKQEATPAPPAKDQPVDPNDVIPVPVAMEPAEIDERAQVVEALRAEKSARREPPARDENSPMEG